ncbi:mechanosensitive ion channel family protein [Georgenia alba]|uniref:Uncharacterized protein n=1 Tax=Georgenia alba TaxID=2233858 RepID=A0ABW2Q9I2_9MICO
MDLTQSLQDTLGSLVAFVPRLLAALVILFIGWIVAKVIEKAVVTVMRKVRFGNLLQRAGIAAPMERMGFGDGSRLLAKILYFAIVLIALQLAIASLGIVALEELLNSLVALLPQIFVALVIVVITGAVANAIKSLFGPAIVRMPAGNLLLSIIVGAIWVIGVFAAIDQVGIAAGIVDTLFNVIVGSLGLILVIKFGVGGVWAAKDRFWPAVYDRVTSASQPNGRRVADTPPSAPEAPPATPQA